MNPPPVSLYERRKPRRIRPAMFFIVFLVVILLVTHFLNLFLQWTVIRLEVAQAPVFKSPEYTFLGFSSFNRKEIAAVRYFEKSSRLAMVFSFFDFFHPAVFAVWNKNDLAFIDLGQLVMAVPAGFSRISFFPGSVFLLEHENKTVLKYFGASPTGPLWHGVLAKNFTDFKPPSSKPLPASFVNKELEKSRYLKIPYLIYFYFPLLIIIFLAIHYGLVMLMAFFYYSEMFFLFDYRKMFVTIPFDWFFKLVNWELSAGLADVIGAVMVVVFVFSAVFGLWHWKKTTISSREKRLILFFILLPFFLFF